MREPEIAVGTRGDVRRTFLLNIELGHHAGRCDSADLIFTTLRKPEIAVRAFGDVVGIRILTRNLELGDHAGWGNPANSLTIEFRKPHFTVWTSGDALRSASRIWELKLCDLTCGRDPADRIAIDFSKPEIAVTEGDLVSSASTGNRKDTYTFRAAVRHTTAARLGCESPALQLHRRADRRRQEEREGDAAGEGEGARHVGARHCQQNQRQVPFWQRLPAGQVNSTITNDVCCCVVAKPPPQ